MTITTEQRKMHILLVDDDPAFRVFTSMVLTHKGYQVSLACDGNEALGMIAEIYNRGERLDLLFTDLNMDVMSGWELISKVRDRGITVPVLVASGYLRDELFEQLQQLNRHKFLVKPFRTEVMLEYVESLVQPGPAEVSLVSENPPTAEVIK
jgi:CheY-like chemotaxis protein